MAALTENMCNTKTWRKLETIELIEQGVEQSKLNSSNEIPRYFSGEKWTGFLASAAPESELAILSSPSDQGVLDQGL